jgi:hypothetical protein
VALLTSRVVGQGEGHDTVLNGKEISVGDFYAMFHDFFLYNKKYLTNLKMMKLCPK